MGEIAELHAKAGDFKHIWDPNDPASVRNAETMFKELKKKGYMMFIPNGDGVGQEIKKFDPTLGSTVFAEKIIAVPPRVGG